jgi:hypothetical protein
MMGGAFLKEEPVQETETFPQFPMTAAPGAVSGVSDLLSKELIK